MPRVRVLIVNFNAGAHLARCLSALRAQTFADFEAVIVDNGSHDASILRARPAVADDPRFRFDEAGENLGFARGNNRAAAGATTPWLATLNPDAFARPDWLARLMDATRRYPDADMFGSTQLSAADGNTLDGAGDAYLALGLPWRGGFGHPIGAAGPDGEVFGPCAAAALYKTDRFRTAGGFDESFFCYCEDVDLAFRLRLGGGRCVQVCDAIVDHVGGGSATDIPHFARYHGTRNLIWTFVKNMPAVLFWPLLPLHAAALLLLAARAVVRGQFSAVASALRDAVCGLPPIWHERRRQQQGRRASSVEIARALCWNPTVYARRAPFAVGPAARAKP